MFKQQRQTKKSNQKLIADTFQENQSNFKSGSIEISTENLFYYKISKLNEICCIPKKNQQFRIVTQRAIISKWILFKKQKIFITKLLQTL